MKCLGLPKLKLYEERDFPSYQKLTLKLVHYNTLKIIHYIALKRFSNQLYSTHISVITTVTIQYISYNI